MGTPLRPRAMHEALRGYLSPVTPPPAVTAPGAALRARQPVGPAGDIPGGLRPVPASTQAPKKTNAQIPYVRQVVSHAGPAGRFVAPREGDIVLVERNWHQQQKPGLHLGNGTNSYTTAHTIETINDLMANEVDTSGPPPHPPVGARRLMYTYDEFPYRLDGVINNVDGEDPENEYRDFTIANVAVYGPCRLDHREATRCDFKVPHPGSVLHVGLEARLANPLNPADGIVHRLVRFSSAQLSRGVYAYGAPDAELLFAWSLGSIMDSNQSQDMITVCVNVAPIRPIRNDEADVEPYQWRRIVAGQPGAPGVAEWLDADRIRASHPPGANEERIRAESTEQQLRRRWDVPRLLPGADLVPPAPRPSVVAGAR